MGETLWVGFVRFHRHCDLLRWVRVEVQPGRDFFRGVGPCWS